MRIESVKIERADSDSRPFAYLLHHMSRLKPPLRHSPNSPHFVLPVELQDSGRPDSMARMIYIISALILVAIVWGSIAEIRELATAHGKVIPTGMVRPVQHLEGGEVEAVLVREGQLVEKGAPLVRLRSASVKADFGELSVRSAVLDLQREILSALIERRKPDFGELENRFPVLAAGQRQVYRSKMQYRKQERRAFAARAAQREAELDGLMKEVASLERQVGFQTEQIAIKKRLFRLGHSSRRSLLDAESQLEQAKSRASAAEGRRRSTLEKLAEARNQLEAADTDALRLLNEERAELTRKLVELQQQIAKQRDRLDRLVVLAPVRGIVQELPTRTKGEVIKPGDLVASLVPIGRKAVAEVRLEPIDVGHVKIGNQVEIEISTFDRERFGVVRGAVSHLSATTYQTEKGEAYYKVIIAFSRDSVGKPSSPNRIVPGMVVKADIITGSKSLMRYLLKPVFRSLNAAS